MEYKCSLQMIICHTFGIGASIFPSTASRGYLGRPVTNIGMIIANKKAIAAHGASLVFECVSNSSQTGVGEITGPDGNTLTTGGIWTIWYNPWCIPGVIRVFARGNFTASNQGIYTCTIPDANGNNITINVGLYPNGFDGEYIVFCNESISGTWDMKNIHCV